MTKHPLPIINSHIHLVIVLPNRFLWLIQKISDTTVGYGLLNIFLHMANPFSNFDKLDKLLLFVKSQKNQNVRSKYIQWKKDGGYSDRTKCVVLTVNMAHMGAGMCKKTFGTICSEHERLRQEFPDNIILFFHADCRSGNMNALFDSYVKNGKWGGVKSYSSMGTFPQDENYEYIYTQLEILNKPVIAHCTYGNPIHFMGPEDELKILLGNKYDKKASRKENCNKFTDPLNWEEVANKHKNLRICLAHGGGADAWREWLINPDDPKNTLNVILGVMKRCQNVYMDISFSANDPDLYQVVYKLMTHDTYSFAWDRILFGSDWDMNKIECTEKQWTDNLSYHLGIEIFNKIARENTHKFLGI